jgi:competence protein ComEC
VTTPDPDENAFTRLTAWMPLFWLALAFLTGIIFDSQVNLSIRLWVVLSAAGLLLAAAARLLLPRLHLQQPYLSPSAAFLSSLAFAFFCLGGARYQVTVPTVDAYHIAWYTDRSIELVVTGTVTAPPDIRDTYTNLRLQTTQVDTGDGDMPVQGSILARVLPGGDWHYGDVVRVRGSLVTPPDEESFSYRDYLARQGILAYMPDAQATLLPSTSGNPFLKLVYGFKERLVTVVYRVFPDPEASLLAGILLGDDNGLPANLQQAFQDTGTTHIIAISGFNIAILAAVFMALFGRLLGRRKGAIVAVACIFVYTLLVGATASVLRAAIMGTLAIFARQVGRRQNGLNTLAATAGIMAVIDPLSLWDVGFQLSFAATLGLILYAQPFQDWFTNLLARRMQAQAAERVARPVGEYILFTLAAQLTTLPVIAWHFGRISLVSILTNPFILPAQPAVMILGGVAVLLGLVYLPLGRLFGWIAWPFAAYTDRAVELFDRIPHGYVALGDFSLLFVVLFYAVLLFLTFASARRKKVLRSILVPSVIIASLGILTFLVWSAVFTAPDGKLRLTFLDVGSANAVLIQTPTGRAILVNGGPSPSQLSGSLGRRLSPFDRSLDWLVVASTGEKELAALPRTLDRFQVDAALWAGPVGASSSSVQVDRWLVYNNVPVTQSYPEASLDLGEGARLTVTRQTPLGALLLVEWGGFRALLPIGMDLNTLTDTNNGQTIGPVTVLLLADSGSSRTNPPEWIASLQPEAAVLSVQAGDPRGLPPQSVLDSLQDITLLRTDQNGWISISTDGTHLWVEVEKK